MNLNLTDIQIELLLKTLAEKHIILYMQRKDNSDLEELITIVSDELKKLDKMHIFNKVFMEYKK